MSASIDDIRVPYDVIRRVRDGLRGGYSCYLITTELGSGRVPSAELLIQAIDELIRGERGESDKQRADRMAVEKDVRYGPGVGCGQDVEAGPAGQELRRQLETAGLSPTLATALATTRELQAAVEELLRDQKASLEEVERERDDARSARNEAEDERDEAQVERDEMQDHLTRLLQHHGITAGEIDAADWEDLVDMAIDRTPQQAPPVPPDPWDEAQVAADERDAIQSEPQSTWTWLLYPAV